MQAHLPAAELIAIAAIGAQPWKNGAGLTREIAKQHHEAADSSADFDWRISLADIVEAVEGPIAMTACVEQGRHDCGVEHSCRVRPHWNAVNDAMRGALAGVSLETLASAPPFASSEVETPFRAEREGLGSARPSPSTALGANGEGVTA